MQKQVELLIDMHRMESACNGDCTGEEWEKIEQQLDPSLLKYYRRVKERRGSGVAVLQNRTCSKCRMVYPEAHPIVRCDQIVHKCEYCGRLLVVWEKPEFVRLDAGPQPFGSSSFEISETVDPYFSSLKEDPEPVREQTIPQQARKGICIGFDKAKPSVLHVDHDEGYRMILRKALEQAGFTVMEARNSRDALEQFSTKRIDLVISELEFPNSGGFELIEELNKRRIETPIIFVTSSYDEDSHIYAMGSGAYECMHKSDGEEKILDIARKAVSEQNGLSNNGGEKELQTAILLVDDDSASRKAIRHLLEPLGYAVFDAASGAEALTALSQYCPDLIISEVMLPDLRGTDLIKKIRSRGIETEIIFVTDSGNWELNVDLMNVGAFDYIDKPLDEDAILSAVSQALE